MVQEDTEVHVGLHVEAQDAQAAATGGTNVYRFAGHTLDLWRGCLRRDDREIELRPKAFSVLRLLVENAGRLMSKEEIFAAVWPRIVVSDESLTRCVSDVRSALADSEHRIVKTVPRRGYVLVAPVLRLARI